MALLWADGLDTYGTSLTFVQQNGYVTAMGQIGNNTANARTGNGYFDCYQTAGENFLCRPLAVSSDTIGQGVGYYNYGTAVSPINCRGLVFLTAVATPGLRVVGNTSLGFSVLNNAGTVLGSSANNLFALTTWVQLEAKATRNIGGIANTGSIEVRLQGATILIVNGIDLPNQWSHVGIGNERNVAGCDLVRFDDWVVWDTSGTKNNDFLGIRRCNTRYPNANSVLQQWTPASGNAWAEVSAVPPVDATSYIQASAAGNVSEFQHTALGVLTNDICGVVAMSRGLLDTAGAATYRIGVNSSGTVENSPDITPGTTGAYTALILENDPNGNIAWTQAAFDAALIRVTRDT